MIDAHLLEAIGDAPDHITALRKLAVAFAIGGHFNDDDSVGATELLASLEAVKNTLRKQGRIGKKKSIWTVLPEHLPEVFDDPTKFVPLGEIAHIEKGKTGIKQAVPGIYPLVVTAATRESCDHFDFEGAAAIIPLVSSTGHGNASINRLHYQEGHFALGTILAAVFPHDTDSTSARFLFEYLSAYKDELLVSRMTGTANVTLSIGRIAEVPVPLLSSNAQAKVDELMTLCDRLEEARKSQEEVRDKLTAASLARLTAPDTTAQAEPAKVGTGIASDSTTSEDDFPTHAAFALEALPALTTRPDQIKTLRQTILNLAVRGKLVEQDPEDESGHVLLERMRQRAEVLRKEAGVRKKKTVAPLDGIDDMGLPEKWSADAFANIIDPRATISYGVLVPGPDVDDGVPFVRAQDLMLSGHPDKPGKVIAHDIESKYARTRLEGGEILLCVVGSIGKLGIAPKKWAGANIARAVARIAPMEEIPRGFTLLFLRSDLAQTYFNEATRTLAQPTLNVGLIEKLPFPIPPLAEQRRIVAKVDALMALCDRLEAALTTADTTRTRLLEALLHEALAPATDTLEAAE